MVNEMEIALTGFDGRGEWKVTVRRPSILTLARLGKIPHPRLGAAAKRVSVGGQAAHAALQGVAALRDLVAEAARGQPAYEQVKEKLTDEQLMELYQFAKGGVDALHCFRRLGGLSAGGTGGKAQRQGGKPGAGH